MHVDPEDHHLAAPPLGAVHQGGVAVAVADLLVLPARERVRTSPVEQHVELARRGLDARRVRRRGRRAACSALAHTPVTISTVLRSSSLVTVERDRVGRAWLPTCEALARASSSSARDTRSRLTGVEQAELPLDPEGAPRGGGEGDVGGVGARVGHGPLGGGGAASRCSRPQSVRARRRDTVDRGPARSVDRQVTTCLSSRRGRRGRRVQGARRPHPTGPARHPGRARRPDPVRALRADGDAPTA